MKTAKRPAVSIQPRATVCGLSSPRRGGTPQPRVATQERTLGRWASQKRTLKGFHTLPDDRRADVQPLQGWSLLIGHSQGALLRRDPGLWWITPSGYRGFTRHRTLAKRAYILAVSRPMTKAQARPLARGSYVSRQSGGRR